MKVNFTKIYYLLFLVISLVLFTSCEKTRNDLFEMSLKGNVKSLVYYSGYLEAGELAQGAMKEKISFNEAGNITELLVYNNKGEVVRRETTFFNEKGEKVKTDYYDDYAMLYQTCFYNYQNGKITSCSYRNEGGELIERVEYSRDDYGYDTLRTSYDREGNVKMFCSSIYGKNGKVLLEEIYNNQHALIRRECCQYNSDNAISRYYIYSVADVSDYEMNYKYEDYDRKGNSRVVKLYDKDHKLLGGSFQAYEYY